jgi:hypothetical protein
MTSAVVVFTIVVQEFDEFPAGPLTIPLVLFRQAVGREDFTIVPVATSGRVWPAGWFQHPFSSVPSLVPLMGSAAAA